MVAAIGSCGFRWISVDLVSTETKSSFLFLIQHLGSTKIQGLCRYETGEYFKPPVGIDTEILYTKIGCEDHFSL